MHPQYFGSEVIGPLFLIFLPFLIIKIRTTKRLFLEMGLFTFLFSIFIFTQSIYIRFYLAVIPFLSVGTAVEIGDLQKKGSLLMKNFLYFLLASILIIHSGIYLYRVRNAWGVVLGTESAEQYLIRASRSFKAYRFLKDVIKPGEKVLNAADDGVFYNPLSSMIRLNQLFRKRLGREGVDLPHYLNKENFDYIWLLEGSNLDVLTYLQSHAYKPVFSYQFVEKPGVFRYVIFKRGGT